MPTVFLSYSRKDHHFAELAGIKLAEEGITLWRDNGQLLAGMDWRGGIERGISESIAVIIALSQHSADSAYVTFEWAYGLGKGKTLIPLKLEDCNVHPRLEPIQYLDFSIAGSLPWNLLVERIKDVEVDATTQEDLEVAAARPHVRPEPLVESIFVYMRQRGYQFISFDRIRRRIDPDQSDEMLNALVLAHPSILKPAVLKDGKLGLTKLVP